MELGEDDRWYLAGRVAALEARTGAQVVTVVVRRCDSYPEAPWKAFALGAALAALFAALRSQWAHDWEAGASAVYHAVAILGAGATLALLTVFTAPLARLFTERTRRRVEVGQYARSQFFDRSLDRTRGRTGILLLVSLLEREVVLLADDGFEGRIDNEDWRQLTDRLTLLLRHAGTLAALRAALEGLEALLLARGYRGDGSTVDELPNAVIEQKGAR